MPWYRYRAEDADGVSFTSTIEADSAYEATVAIRELGVELESLERVPGPESPPRPELLEPPLADEPSFRLEPVDDRPPPAPREIPPGVSGTPGGMILILVGGIFVAISSIMIVVGLFTVAAGNREGWFIAGIPSIHFLVGSLLLFFAIRGRSERRRIVQDGAVALGHVENIGFNRSVRVNGRNPFKMSYRFEVAGVEYEGSHSSMDEALKRHRRHDRIWVLYDVDDPSKSVEWPPF
ncbi:MAG: hypothetical protein AAF567_22830 [Actinomycetota bacterium]